MIIVKSPEDLVRMRPSCRMAARVLEGITRQISPGITTRELDEYAAGLIAGFGGKSAFFGYRGYPGYICLSVNEEVVHGVPGRRRIELGDIVSVDVGVRYEGYVGDTAATIMVGVTEPDVIRLVNGTYQALQAGIAKARVGGWLSDISHAIESCAKGMGFAVVRDYVGHGIGKSMHEDPQIPNFGPAGHGPVLKVGMTLAVEPMINMGTGDVDLMPDGWTVLTRDRKPSAHFEHTVAIGAEGAEILTVWDGSGTG